MSITAPAQTVAVEEPLARYRSWTVDMLNWARIVHWDFVVAEGVLDFCADFLSVYGYKPESMLPFTVDNWKRLIHPDDNHVMLMFEKMIEGHADTIDTIFRMKTASGEWRYFRNRGGVAESRIADKKAIRISGTLQDITELKIADVTLQRRDRLLAAVNEVANILLMADPDDFDDSVPLVLHILGTATDVDRVYVWQNERLGNELRCSQICEWSPHVKPQQGSEYTIKARLPQIWEERLGNGECVNGIVQDMSQAERNHLLPQGIVSVLVAPILFRDEFWGFIGFDDCQYERIWDKTEAGILKSAGMLIASAIQRRRMEKALILAKDNAEIATKAKSEFLARMSHEIRTPMNAILGMIYLCLRTGLNKKQEDYLKKTQSAANNLLGIINDVLDISKIEAGRLELELIPFSLDKTIDDVIDIVQPIVDEKGLKFVKKIDPRISDRLVGDPLRLRQILLNLLNNAIKFTSKGGVFLTIQPDESPERRKSDQICLVFEVKDTGIGLQPEQVEGIFESFAQADGSTTRKYGGTGLGLAIVKSLVELMQGKVSVSSIPGQGARFQFTAVFEAPGTEPDMSSALLLSRRRVLIIDDDANDLEVLMNLLESMRMKVVAARTGLAALEKLEEATYLRTPFELVLVDWRMPRMDGIETVRRIRQNDKILPPYILMLSAYDRQECLRQVQGLHVAEVLEKPIHHGVLKEALKLAFREDLPEKTSEVRADIRGAKVLLAEDNKINQIVASELLDMLNVQVTIANNGMEAVEAVKKEDFDLILMDIQMPEMDGLTAVQVIRTMGKPGVDKLPILAMTANALDTDYQKSLEAGMDDHLTKPIDPEKLRIALEKWIVR